MACAILLDCRLISCVHVASNRQDIARISHRDSVADLIRKGRLLEKNTLVYAVKAHLEDRIIHYNNKCVVFGE